MSIPNNGASSGQGDDSEAGLRLVKEALEAARQQEEAKRQAAEQAAKPASSETGGSSTNEEPGSTVNEPTGSRRRMPHRSPGSG